MTSIPKAEAVVLRLRKLHQQTLKLDESYQNVSSNSTQRSSSSRIKKASSNGKYLQPQIPPTTKPDDLLKTSKKTKKEFDIDSDLFSSDSRVETKQKSYQPKKKSVINNEISNQRPPFSNAKKNLISTIEDTNKPSNQRSVVSNTRKNQLSNADETNRQQITKPPFSTGKVNYSSATNDLYSASKQKQKLTNRTVKNSSNNLNAKKNDQPKKQDQPIRKQSLSKKSEQPIKTEISTSIGNRNNISKRKVPNEEIELNSTKQQLGVTKLAKEVERNPKSSRFTSIKTNPKESINDDIPLYDFKTRQTDTIQNIIINRSDKINEAYRKVPQAQTITTTNDEYIDPSDELIRQAAAFLRNRKKKESNTSLSVLQKSASPVKKNPVPQIQQENKPFSWGNTLKSINDDVSNDINSTRNKSKKYSTIRTNVSDYQSQININNSNYKDDYGESDELNLFFTPEKELSKGVRKNSISAYSNSNLKATLLDESDSASLANDDLMKGEVYLSTGSETEIVPDSLNQATNGLGTKDQFVDKMRKKLNKVLNSDSAELSSSSDVGRPEVNNLITISKGTNNRIYSDLTNSDESEDMFNLQKPQQQFSVVKNPNSKLSSLKNYSKVNSSNLSRFAQNARQNAFSSEADDYLSSDSKSEEMFSITEKRKEDTNIIKSRNIKFNRNQNQGNLTVEQIKKNYLDSSTDNSSTKSVEYEEFPDLIITNKSPKKAIKEFNIVKNQVLNDIQSSDSSSPEVLKFYSKKNDLNKKEDSQIQKSVYDPFNTSKYSSIVLSEFDSLDNIKLDENSNTINDDDDDEIPVVKKPPKPESQINAAVEGNKNKFAQKINLSSDEDEGEDDIIPEMKKSPQPEPQIAAKKSTNINQAAQQKFLQIDDVEEDEIDDYEILAMKKPPQPESIITASSNENQINQQKNSEIKNDEDDVEDNDDEIPAIKKPPQPEPQILSSNSKLTSKNQDSQQKVMNIKKEEEDEDDDDYGIPVVKKPPQPEPQILSSNSKLASKKQDSQQKVINIKKEEEDEDDDDDYGIPVMKKPPQPEPQIDSIMPVISSSNKDQFSKQKVPDINDDDDDYKNEIPIPHFDALSNNKDSKEKALNSTNINSAIDLDSDDIDNSKREKKKLSPLHVSPPIGITYFSKASKNEKFQPLQFDDNNELKEDVVVSDKEDILEEEDEKIEISKMNENHSLENDDNEDFANDSFDEKLKMARSTISKIKENQQKGQKSFNLFTSNLIEEEEEEKLENYNLIDKKEEEDSETESIIISSSKKDKKQLQFNVDDDNELNGNQFKPSSINEKKQIQIDSIDDDIDNFDGSKFKSSSIKTADNENNQIKSDEKGKGNDIKRPIYKNFVSDDVEEEEENEQFKLNDIINNKNDNNEKKQIKLENFEVAEELDKDRFKLDNIQSDDDGEEIEKPNKFDFKEENEQIENKELNTGTKVENLFNKKLVTSGNIEGIKQQNIVNVNKIENEKSEEEEENVDHDGNVKNADIIINPKIELEEDEEEDPIDPYFLDNNISDDSSDLKEKQDTKTASLSESTLVKKQNQENDDDVDINDFENLKRNFLKQEFKIDDDENEMEEEEKAITKSNKEQNSKPSDLLKDSISNIIDDDDEKDENEILNKVNNDEDDEEEDDEALLRLKKLYSQNKVASAPKIDDNSNTALNPLKPETNPSNIKINALNFMKMLVIEEEEEEENDAIVSTEKASNSAHLPNKMNFLDEEDEEEENVIASIIKGSNLAHLPNEMNILDEEEDEGVTINSTEKASSSVHLPNKISILDEEDEDENNATVSTGKASNLVNHPIKMNILDEEEEEDKNNATVSTRKASNLVQQSIKMNILDEEEEEDENNATVSTRKASNLVYQSIEMNILDEEEEEDELTNINKKIEKQEAENDLNLEQNSNLDNSLNQENKGYSNLNDSSALDFMNQEDFLEDRLFLSKNKTKNDTRKDSKDEEEEGNEIDVIQSNVPGKDHDESQSMQLIKKINSLLIEEDDDEDEIEEKSPKNINDTVKKDESFARTQIENEDEEINQNKSIKISKSIELESKITIGRPQTNESEESKTQLQKPNEVKPALSGSKDQNVNVEYEYEYEEEIIEQNDIPTDDINIGVNVKPVLNIAQVENKKIENENQSQSQIQIQNVNENDKKQKDEMNEANYKQSSVVIKKHIVEYEYEYEEEEVVEQSEKLPIETNSKPALNQPHIEVKQEEEKNPLQIQNEANSKVPNGLVRIQTVEYEYEYEEEVVEQPQITNNEKGSELASNLPQIKDKKEKQEEKQITTEINDSKEEEIEEEEDFDEEAIIKRLQNFKDFDFNKNFDENILAKNDLLDDEINDKKVSKVKISLNSLEEEEEEDISDDSLIKRLDQGISLMGKDIDDENGDENGYGDIDGDILNKRMQDFLNMPISDDDDKDENSLLEKDI